MKKHFYTTITLLTLLTTGAFAQTDLSLSSITPVTDQHFPNIANDDTFHVLVVLTNLGPDSLKNTDSVQVWLNLDWVMPAEDSNLIWTDTYIATELNSRLSGGKDTIDLSLVQGADFGLTDLGNPRIVKIPNDRKTNAIKIQAFSWDPISEELLNDPGTGFNDDGYRVGTGNNIVNPLDVVFGTPVGIKSIDYTKSELKIFPNPTENQISFTNEFTATLNAVVKITDITGRLIKTTDLGKQSAGAKTFNIDIHELKNGVYYIELITDSTRSIAKFTKQ